jgi:CSLREA domain-containing protein
LKRALNLLAAFVLVLTQLMMLSPSTASGAPVVTVNSTGDATDVSPGDGICSTGAILGDGAQECTLRAAMQEANASSVDEIAFAIPSGPYVITPGSPLPPITDRVSIDATTQPGFAGSPVIVLDGASAGTSTEADGFLIYANRSTIRGFVIQHFHDDGVELHGSVNRVYGNHIFDNDDGVLVYGSLNRIGGISAGQANVIYGNNGHGVAIESPSDSRNVILSNSIYGNEELGIDLPKDPGDPDANDPGDGDVGANYLLNHPVITQAAEAGGIVYVEVDLDVPDGSYRIEIFSNPGGADPSGYGEGEELVLSTVVSRTSGNSSFSFTVPGSPGDVLTATATRCRFGCDQHRATSEFSPAETVVLGNHAPVLDAIEPIAVDEGTPVSIVPVASDEDAGDTLTFGMVGAPAGATIDPDTGELTWIPTEADGPGVYSIDITVTDDGWPANLTDSTTVTIAVGEVNQGPDLTDPGDQTVDEETPLTFLAMATDPDLPANDLLFELVGAPAGAAIDPGTGEFTWIPTEMQGPGVYSFDIVVSDQGSPVMTDTESVTVTVLDVNRPPDVVSPGDQVDAEGEVVALEVVATDADYPVNTLVYDATGLPPGLAIDPVTGQISGVVDYIAAATSPYLVTVTVTDDGLPSLSTQVQFQWVTPNTNRPPAMAVIADKTVNEQTELTFGVSASDPDSDAILTYALNGAPPGAAIDPGTGQFSWTPAEGQGPGTYLFDIVVNDNGIPDLTGTRSVGVTVHEVNRPPVVVDPPDRTVDEQTTLTFPVTASDPDLPVNTLSYRLSGAPTGASINPGTGQFTWTPSEVQGPGVYAITVIVSDNGSPRRSDSATFTVTVSEVNRAPALADPADQTSVEGDTIDLAVIAADPDRPHNTLRYSATGLPPGLGIDPVTGRITGAIRYDAALPPYTTQTGYTPVVTVRDQANPEITAQAQFTWWVGNTNRAPVLTSPGVLTVDEHSTLDVDLVSTDPDAGATLTHRGRGLPPGAVLDPGTGRITWTPGEEQGPGTYVVTVTVTDDDPVNPISTTLSVTIVVDEVNVAPVAQDDSATTIEDQVVVVPVLDNDSDEDLPANGLRVVELGRPGRGHTTVSDDGVLYTPPANFNGTVSFRYTVGDGTATATATATVVVTGVNDDPVAEPDAFRLVEYKPAILDVLDNDSDADGEPLSITLGSFPDEGEASIEDNQIVYKPRNGWTGAVEFTYVVHDPNGATDTATVRIMVGNEVLIGARALADTIGVNRVPFEQPPAPEPEPEPELKQTGLSLIDLGGITLLADSFFQTVDALRVPLGFLGFTVVMIVGFGTTTEVPSLLFGTRRRHWAVVRLDRQQRLPAYSEPGGRKVVYNYDPTATGVVSVGAVKRVGNTGWVPVDTPNGAAWIYRSYLTEQVDLQSFANDRRPVELVHKLAEAIRRGRDISSLVSPEGLVVALTGSSSQIAPEHLAALMGESRLRHLPGVGRAPNTPEEFDVAVAQPFLEAYDATTEISAATPHSKSALIPTECWNFPYLALGGHGVQPWLVFFEYRDGKALIAALGVDE